MRKEEQHYYAFLSRHTFFGIAHRVSSGENQVVIHIAGQKAMLDFSLESDLLMGRNKVLHGD
jgi:hypothetical protein